MSYARAKGWQTKPRPGCFVDPTHPLSRGLVGCWLFNEGAGSRLTDYSGNGNHGTLTNMNPENDWVGSPRGGALDFDGINDYVDSGFLELSEQVTFCIGFIPLNFPNSYKFFAGSDNNEGNSGIAIANDSNNRFYFAVKNGFYSMNSQYSVGSHYFLCGVCFTGIGNIPKLYVNGKLHSTGTGAAITDNFNGGNLYFGKTPRTGGFFAKCLIETVYLYNTILNDDEIKWLYSEPYANILRPTWRKYFVPMAIGGNTGRFVHQYRQRRNFV